MTKRQVISVEDYKKAIEDYMKSIEDYMNQLKIT